MVRLNRNCFSRLWYRHVGSMGMTCRNHYIRGFSQSGGGVTKVEKIILDHIKATGPISFATYMQLCLSHPTEGYYMNISNSVFGAQGDFTTSPEISQVFGELVGIWLLSQWMNAGQSQSFRVIELGPGRGTLMTDILRVISQFPVSLNALRRVHLIENSARMRSIQSESLLPLSQKSGWQLSWHDSINDVPEDAGEYTMLVAHEFFDALPIHLLEKTHQGWQELLISFTVDPVVSTIYTNSNPQSRTASLNLSPPASTSLPRLGLVLAPPTPASTLLGLSSPRFQKLPVGSRIEVSPASFKIARKVGEVLSANGTGKRYAGGAALVVDYGGEKVFGNSLRAFKDHKIVDAFHRPGECDLTANVDFAYLMEAMAGLATPHGPLPQAVFLERMGLQLRVDALTHAALTEERRVAITEAAHRLVDRTGMGTEYQVLGLTSGRSQDTWPFLNVQGDAKS